MRLLKTLDKSSNAFCNVLNWLLKLDIKSSSVCAFPFFSWILSFFPAAFRKPDKLLKPNNGKKHAIYSSRKYCCFKPSQLLHLLQNPLRSRLNGTLKIFSFFFFSFQNRIHFFVATQIESLISSWKLERILRCRKSFLQFCILAQSLDARDANFVKYFSKFKIWRKKMVRSFIIWSRQGCH